MRRPSFEETSAIRLKWFYEILEHEDARLRKRQRSRESSFRVEADGDMPRYSPALRLDRRRLRDANSAFQMDWGLGDQSSIMPLPLESEYLAFDDHAVNEASDESEQDVADSSDIDELNDVSLEEEDGEDAAGASEPQVIRLRPGQRLVRYV
ncbi:hypothetical protein MCAP1_002114 [Malassezia caprae]|uniref:Uncharacterized protein n=1 Tax=Malassezia caprae TaxID=1381934 RepID=A0AAF0E7N7_9BASI|nr:hypothetical protein MCAP1_002114 [Malassezia caprae]